MNVGGFPESCSLALIAIDCLAVVTPQKDGRDLHVSEGSYVCICIDICELDTEKGSFF